MVNRESWAWNKAQLPVALRYSCNSGAFWDGCNGVQRWRWRLGRGISSHALHLFELGDSFVRNACTDVNPYWRHIGLPRGCSVELQMFCTYRARLLE